jgi:parallel beta-helix repeat protein
LFLAKRSVLVTRTPLLTLVLALACVPAFAAPPAPPRPPQPSGLPNTSAVNMNSPRMQAARQWAMAGILGNRPTPADMNSADWEPRYTLFVACPYTPSARTYPNIGAAVSAAQPYTLILVCRETDAGSVDIATDHIAIQGVGAPGNAIVNCPGNLDHLGIGVDASYVRIRNLTFQNCYAGVLFNVSTSPSGFQYGEVSSSAFIGNATGILSQLSAYIRVTNNRFRNTSYGIYLDGDISDSAFGNDISADQIEFAYVAITVETDTGSRVSENAVRSYQYAIVLEGGSLSTVEDNRMYGNNSGLYSFATEGDVIRDNTANGGNYGFYLDIDNGVNDPNATNPLPDRILFNEAFGNSVDDYFDGTAPYTGGAPGTNDGTANYYDGNRGKTASPPAILTQ